MSQKLNVNCKTGKETYSTQTQEDIQQGLKDKAQNEQDKLVVERNEKIADRMWKNAEDELIVEGKIEARD